MDAASKKGDFGRIWGGEIIRLAIQEFGLEKRKDLRIQWEHQILMIFLRKFLC